MCRGLSPRYGRSAAKSARVIEVTADANIYISALEFAGVPLQILDHARRGAVRLYVSEPILDDVRRVLRDKFLWQPDLLDEALAELGAFTVKVEPAVTLHVVEADPDDDRVLECAVAAGSRYIVTGDKDLLRLGSYNAIQILKAADFLKLLELPPESPAGEEHVP
jgi:putative PIN family toxin of toxin-antitoxin system